MSTIPASEKDAFFADVEAAAKKAIWCAMATVSGNEPRVRMVHPTWEGDTLWVATGPQTAKAKQLQANGAVDIQFQVAPDDFVHLMVRGNAEVLTDQPTKDRIWDVMDYDLARKKKNGYHQAKSVPVGKDAVEFMGSTTGPSYTEAKCSPLQVAWNVSPSCNQMDINSVHKWCKKNKFAEKAPHGVRQLVTNKKLLGEIK